MRLQRVFYIFIIILGLQLACSQDSEDIQSFQTMLKNPIHTKIFLSLKSSLDLRHTGFDNVIAMHQLKSLRRNTQIYLKFLDKFEPQYPSTKKMHENLKQPLKNFDNELSEMASRLNAYRDLTRKIDSLSNTTNKTRLATLDQQEQLLHRRLTNQFLIGRTTELMNKINRELEIIYQH